MFGAFNHLFVDDIERETFEVSLLDTTIALEGWLDCETGLDDLNCQELHKRLRPFIIQAFVPFSDSHRRTRNLPTYALQRGLRVLKSGGSIANERNFEQLPPQQQDVGRYIVDSPKTLINNEQRRLGLNLDLEKGVGMELITDRLWACLEGRLILNKLSSPTISLIRVLLLYNISEQYLSSKLMRLMIFTSTSASQHWRGMT